MTVESIIAQGTLEGHIAALVAQGYEVTFGLSGGRPEAFIVKGDDTALAHGETHAEALWAVSPLHADGEPFPDVPRCERCGRYPIAHRGGECIHPRGESPEVKADRDTERAEIWERLDDAEERLGKRDDRDRTERALVHVIIDLLCDLHPDGELARHVKADRDKGEQAAARVIDGYAGAGARD